MRRIFSWHELKKSKPHEQGDTLLGIPTDNRKNKLCWVVIISVKRNGRVKQVAGLRDDKLMTVLGLVSDTNIEVKVNDESFNFDDSITLGEVKAREFEICDYSVVTFLKK